MCIIIMKMKNYVSKNSISFKQDTFFADTSVHAPLVDAMRAYKDNPCTGFHIPGHNRGQGVLDSFSSLVGIDALNLDTTDEFDNLGTLFPSTGAIDEAQKLASKVFNSKRTFFLTGGSTIANLALAFALTCPNDKIAIGRNCHRSVLSGMIISGANPQWIMPKKLDDWAIYGALNPLELQDRLENNPDISLVWVTNPTYEGVVSDVEAIARVCHEFDVPLIVDEAHGCLWNFSEVLPKSALECGADAVVHSLHKTGGSMTQSSMLHISQNSRFDVHKVEHALKLLHTTSPSLLLLTSLDAARAYLSSQSGKDAINNAINNALYFRERASKINGVKVLNSIGGVAFDVTKIFLKVNGLSGKRLESILELDFSIEIESASDEGILILSNIGNTQEEFNVLLNALNKIASSNYPDLAYLEGIKFMPLIAPEVVMSPRDAYFSKKERVSKEDAIGRICAEVIALCPPGISVLLPGELVTKDHMPYLSDFSEIDVLEK